MCFFGGGRSTAPSTQPVVSENETAKFDDSPPVVTGSQTGVDNPKDTKKATEQLKINRLKKEGKYVEPKKATDLSAVEEKLTRRSGNKFTVKKVDGRLKKISRNTYRKGLRQNKKNTRPKGAHGGASDIRLKENIVQTGISKMGYKIYEFNYKNDDTRYRGAMAQDVITKLPEAIGVRDGFLYVDYDMIDINMEVI